MVLWSGVVRVPLAVKNRKIIGSEITTVTITTIRKKIPESGTCTTSREGSKITIFIFFFFFFLW